MKQLTNREKIIKILLEWKDDDKCLIKKLKNYSKREMTY